MAKYLVVFGFKGCGSLAYWVEAGSESMAKEKVLSDLPKDCYENYTSITVIPSCRVWDFEKFMEIIRKHFPN